MKNAIYENEYISNKKEVYNILKNKDIKLIYNGINNMPHDKQKMYAYTLTINGVDFDYYEGLGHNKLDSKNIYYKIINALWCLLLDSDTITFFKSLDDFMSEYGYLDYKKALDTFKGLKINSTKLKKVFTSKELNFLKENISL